MVLLMRLGTRFTLYQDCIFMYSNAALNKRGIVGYFESYLWVSCDKDWRGRVHDSPT